MYLAADYTPEFDSFKERLLELAQIRSVAELLRCVVTRLAEPPYVALARIWLVDKGDLCSTCCMSFVGRIYQVSGAGSADGHYCPFCYDSGGEFARLGRNANHWQCCACEAVFYD